MNAKANSALDILEPVMNGLHSKKTIVQNILQWIFEYGCFQQIDLIEIKNESSMHWTVINQNGIPLIECTHQSSDETNLRVLEYQKSSNPGIQPYQTNEKINRTNSTEQSYMIPISNNRHSYGYILLQMIDKFDDAKTVLDDINRFVKIYIQYRELIADQEQYEQQSIMDELTGLYNRRFLNQKLDSLILEARTNRFTFSLMMIDVDFFKNFNDQYGHSTGDLVLKTVSKLMKRVFRENDFVCRYGGEEFCIVLVDRPETDSGSNYMLSISKFAERLRIAAEEMELIDHEGNKLQKVTISGGLATYPWDASTKDTLIDTADRALYVAKKNGRNQIVIANPANRAKAG